MINFFYNYKNGLNIICLSRSKLSITNQHASIQTFDNEKINVLYVHWKRKGNTASQINNPYLKIVNELTSYADGKDIYDHDTMTFEKCYFDMKVVLCRAQGLLYQMYE